MFDPRDISSDPRTLTPERPKRDYLKERQDRKRTGSRAEFDPRSGGEGFTGRTERAVAEIGMYRTVAYKDLSEAHFDGHPYATRRAVDRMIQQGDVQEQTAKGPQGGTYKVLTLTGKGVHRAEVAAQDQAGHSPFFRGPEEAGTADGSWDRVEPRQSRCGGRIGAA